MFLNYHYGLQIKEDGKSGTCSTHEKGDKQVQRLGSKMRKKRGHLEDIVIDRRVISKLVSEK
jgi:hypothetical protein